MSLSPGQLSIVIVDDHSVVREGLRGLIDREPDMRVCAEAANIRDALQAYAREKPNAFVIDLALGGENGLELIKQLRELDSQLPMLVLSMHNEAHYAERALRHGANGYVMKEEATSLLLAALREVLNGKLFVSPNISDRLLRTLSGPARVARGPDVERLSNRELEIFRLVGTGFGTTEIAERLQISKKTVETHRARIKEKLGLETARELVVRAATWVAAEGRNREPPP